jgi:glycine hydroxymethyltransferase
MVSSGLRVGTPALATRGFGKAEFTEVAEIIAAALKRDFSDETAAALRQRVENLADKFPLYPNLSGKNGDQ